jgi:hypothetical protein
MSVTAFLALLLTLYGVAVELPAWAHTAVTDIRFTTAAEMANGTACGEVELVGWYRGSERVARSIGAVRVREPGGDCPVSYLATVVRHEIVGHGWCWLVLGDSSEACAEVVD